MRQRTENKGVDTKTHSVMVALVLVVTASQLVACSSNSSSDESSSEAVDAQALFEREVVSAASAADQAIAECMITSGFTYEPLSASVDEVFGGPPGGVGLDEDDGYGVVRRELEDRGSGPNVAYFEALAPAEQDAFNVALVGSQPLPEPYDSRAGPNAHVSWLTLLSQIGVRGCAGESLAANPPPQPSGGPATFDEEQAIEEALRADEEYAGMVEEWASCMAEAGLAFSTPLAALNSVQIAVGQAAAGGELSVEEVDDLRARELETANVDIECGGIELLRYAREFKVE